LESRKEGREVYQLATRGRKPKPTALKLLEGKKQARDFLIIADQTTVFLLFLVFGSTVSAGAVVQ